MLRPPPQSSVMSYLFPYPTLFAAAVATGASLLLRRIADAEIARDELAAVIVQHRPGAAVRAAGGRGFLPAHQLVLADDGPVALHPAVARRRSDERRVGKEGVSTCRSRMSPYQ